MIWFIGGCTLHILSKKKSDLKPWFKKVSLKCKTFRSYKLVLRQHFVVSMFQNHQKVKKWVFEKLPFFEKRKLRNIDDENLWYLEKGTFLEKILISVPGWSSPEVVDSAIKAFDTFYFGTFNPPATGRIRTLVNPDRD